MPPRRRKNTAEELLNDIKYVGILGVWFQGQQLAELKQINERIGNMANIEEVQAAVSRIEGNTANVARVLGELNTTNAALVQQVADLQAQVEAGNAVTPEQLQGLLDRLSAADAAMDTLAPDSPNEPNVPTE